MSSCRDGVRSAAEVRSECGYRREEEEEGGREQSMNAVVVGGPSASIRWRIHCIMCREDECAIVLYVIG